MKTLSWLRTFGIVFEQFKHLILGKLGRKGDVNRYILLTMILLILVVFIIIVYYKGLLEMIKKLFLERKFG